ncbi:sugar phosphate isomerase/epimerase family protein [Sediminibacterium soli]|uniref:sugar phosphate isomerase/epimerase family protein n=1 Tax=Sediminibacterium soli TaxID=2698829 RepID=UPI00137A2998|nr:sugar phosphate isomerase/epimerase family protein [Sediminibacterium soli]NCI48244.1 sugar phosphate isomerase/epimerase [Sediminibacterium soli]
MPTSRRSFLRKTSVLIAGSGLLSRQVFAAAAKEHITGIQLYSVRDDMRKDPLATLKALSDMGYRYVEHANYVNRKFYGYTAADFKKVLADNGLKMPSGHTVMGRDHWDATKKEFSDSWKYTVEDAAAVGQELVISPWLDENLRKNYDDMKRYMEVFNKSGELCRKSGMRFGYHNHNFEFTQKLNDTLVYDIILESTDPSLVTQQLDIGNLYSTGANALEIVKKHPGRFVSLHVKDETKSAQSKEIGSGYESTVLGTGVANTKAITDEARKLGTTHFIIEQESYQGKAPIDAVSEDLKVMKSWGY